MFFVNRPPTCFNKISTIHVLSYFQGIKILENRHFSFSLCFFGSGALRFNFVDLRRSTSRVTEIEISPPSPMLVVSPICGEPAESPRKEDIFKCMQALCAEFRDANIYTRVNLQSAAALIMLSRSPRSELNTGSKMASIPRLT